jgi:hypothetical protein
MKRLPIKGRREFAIVDDEDYDRLKKFVWKAHIRPVDGVIDYVERYRHQRLHWDVMGKKRIDHRNGDVLDNRRKNLRRATHSQNMCNRKRHSDNKSGFKGVVSSRNRWVAYIQYKGIHKNLGSFGNPIDAAKAYDEAAKKIHGRFARTNFPMRFPRHA